MPHIDNQQIIDPEAHCASCETPMDGKEPFTEVTWPDSTRQYFHTIDCLLGHIGQNRDTLAGLVGSIEVTWPSFTTSSFGSVQELVEHISYRIL